MVETAQKVNNFVLKRRVLRSDELSEDSNVDSDLRDPNT
jgi:hypothetical protein